MYVITCTRILLKSSYKVPRDASFSISSSLYVPTYMTSCEYGIDFTPCYQPPPKRGEPFQWRNRRSTTRGWLFGLWVNTKNKVSFCHNVEEVGEGESCNKSFEEWQIFFFFHIWKPFLILWFLRFFLKKGGLRAAWLWNILSFHYALVPSSSIFWRNFFFFATEFKTQLMKWNRKSN